MKIKCNKCGFEDEGKFCSKCGSPLTSPVSSITETQDNIPVDTPWFNKCPVCKTNKPLEEIHTKLFSLTVGVSYECSNCGSKFSKSGDKYKVTNTSDTSNTIWQEYKNQALTTEEWKRIAYGGMSDEKQQEADMDKWVTRVKEGNIPKIENDEELIRSVHVILKRDEEMKLILPNIKLIEPRMVRTGGYGGPSIRVAKGLYFRVGSFSSESHAELRNIDQGIFILTNRRIIFSGSRHTADIDLKKIVSVEPYKDGIGLRRSKKEKMQYFTGIDIAKIAITIDGRSYKETLSGVILMYMIEGLTKLLE